MASPDALQFSGGSFGDLGHEKQLFRHLEIRQPGGDEIAQLAFGRLLPLAQHHGGGHLFAKFGVRHSEGDDMHFGNARLPLLRQALLSRTALPARN